MRVDFDPGEGFFAWLTVSFRKVESAGLVADGEWDHRETQGISSDFVECLPAPKRIHLEKALVCPLVRPKWVNNMDTCRIYSQYRYGARFDRVCSPMD